jgi:hypothetical protein
VVHNLLGRSAKRIGFGNLQIETEVGPFSPSTSLELQPKDILKDFIKRIEFLLLARSIGTVAVLARGSSGSTVVPKLIVFPSPGLVDQCLIGIQSLPEAFGRARVARVQIWMPPQSKRPEGFLDFFLTRSDGNP